MKEFNRLVAIISDLLGPNGCPWDQKQTLKSIRKHLIEEAYEVVEAIDDNDRGKIVEELGDLFLNVVFLSKLGEKEKGIQMPEILDHINEKLIRRHPHVYGDASASSPEEVLNQWDKIKQEEKKHQRKSRLDEIPKDLPSILRAQKAAKIFGKAQFAPKLDATDDSEMKLGIELYELIQVCQENGVEADIALRKVLAKCEKEFRNQET